MFKLNAQHWILQNCLGSYKLRTVKYSVIWLIDLVTRSEASNWKFCILGDELLDIFLCVDPYNYVPLCFYKVFHRGTNNHPLVAFFVFLIPFHIILKKTSDIYQHYKNKYKPTKFLKDNLGVNNHIALAPLMFIANMHYFQCHFLSILVTLDYISYCFPLIFFLHCSINVLVVLPFFLIVFPLILCFWCLINMFNYNCIYLFLFFSFLCFWCFIYVFT